jgi:hypothetical protein
MLGSQALEALTGLALTMSIVSLAASTIVEMIAGWLKWRATMLERAVGQLLAGTASDTAAPAAPDLLNTTVVRSLAGPGRRFPSYISRDSFVDAIGELAQGGGEVPAGVRERLGPGANRQESPAQLRATLERHFDETMNRVSGAYKRRTSLALFLVGLFIAAVGNISVYHIARSLWSDTTTRQAVVQAARNVDPNGIDASDLESVGTTVSQLEEVGVPVGWTDQAKADWGRPRSFPLTRVGLIIGWLVTGVLVTLGAPFWFDLLSRLISLRTSGAKPKDSAATDKPAQPSPQTVPDGGPRGAVESLVTVPTESPPAPDPELLIRRAIGAAS